MRLLVSSLNAPRIDLIKNSAQIGRGPVRNRVEQPGPFLKWAGGKRALLGDILPNIPEFTGKYVEPFLGAGAVFFQIGAGVQKVASDQNSELIDTYTVVRDYPERLIEELRKHKNEKEHFLAIREMDREAQFFKLDIVERAARFIFLNKTCFNGLYRVNSNGHFNVPFGNQKNPDIVSEKQILNASAYLRHRLTGSKGKFSSQLFTGDYKAITKSVKEDDFVYMDPPYHPISTTSNFVTYGKNGFNATHQEELRDEVLLMHTLGAKIMLSNSDTPLIRKLFSSRVFHKKTVSVRRAISAKSEGRAPISELLITNYRMRP
jgi:DNA adenine methylase